MCLPRQVSASRDRYPSLHSHLVAIKPLHSVATEFVAHAPSGEADVMHSPKNGYFQVNGRRFGVSLGPAENKNLSYRQYDRVALIHFG